MVILEGFRRFLYETRFSLNRKQVLSEPGEPVFDEPTRIVFHDEIARAKVYVEYGSGGTTLLAANSVPLIVSVESDRHYRKLVARKLAEVSSPSEVHLLHGKIGPTAEWGMPIFRAGLRAISGQRYFSAPWNCLARMGAAADFVLIDGRYRVACTLATLLHPLGENALILLDDFEGRHWYAPVLDFTDVIGQAGRSLLLRRRRAMEISACQAVLRGHLRDWR